MNRKKWTLFALAGLLFAGCSAPAAGAAYERITMEQAASRMEEEKDYLLLDVRTQEEYEAGHIPGAICLPNETIEGQEPEELPDKDQTIFVYCRSGNRSRQAAQKLADMGYTRIVEMGGIGDWPGETVAGREP